LVIVGYSVITPAPPIEPFEGMLFLPRRGGGAWVKGIIR
jgi:hypothetical protein